jgi:hypothetical protein
MRKTLPAENPAAYVAALSGWQHECVLALRAAVASASTFEEVVKWRHLVYICQGPAVLIRAEALQVLLGFWQDQRPRAIEPRLRPGGKYEMATLSIEESMIVDPVVVGRIAAEAAALNRLLGDPSKPG